MRVVPSIALLGLLAGASAFSVTPALRPVRARAAVGGQGPQNARAAPPLRAAPHAASAFTGRMRGTGSGRRRARPAPLCSGTPPSAGPGPALCRAGARRQVPGPLPPAAVAMRLLASRIRAPQPARPC